MMKRWKTILIACLILSLLLPLCPTALAEEDFSDVAAEAGYAEAVAWAKAAGITTGKDETVFDPESAVTRAEAVTFLWRAEGCQAPHSAEGPFTDLAADWYRDAVLWAVEQGITRGVSDTEFAPDAPVTRTQMATFLYRMAGEPGSTGEGKWYSDAVRWAFDHILIFGSSLPLSGGEDACLRADVVTYLYRYFHAPDPAENEEIIILFTSDVHCGIDRGFGYAGLYQIRTALEDQGYTVLLVDDGDAIQGEAVGTMSKGGACIGMMNALGYDAAIPGNHEFDYGMDRFLELAEEAEYPYISCNFNREGELVFAPYVMVEAAGKKLAFVGVTTPKTLTSSTPSNFQNEAGEFIYGFLQDSTGEGVYEAVQSAADAARAEGADYVYVLGHMGFSAVFSPWSYADVIGHTEGIDVFLDGHSHDTEQVVMKNRAGKTVARSGCGTKLACIGYSRITPEGIAETGIWTWQDPVSAPETYGLRNELGDAVAAALDELEEAMGTVVAGSSVRLTIFDPEATDAAGKPIRMVRRAETNLGDFCADAVRAVSGAQIAVMNGGGIRTDVEMGEVTNGDIFNVFPFGNELCVLEVTGQQLLDALEWGARAIPGETGAFLQVSGLSYEINADIPSPCLTGDNGMCVGFDGPRRAANVRVGGEPLDPQKLYTLAGMDYTLLKNGDGTTAFDGAKVLQEGTMLDNQLLIEYITEYLDGVIGEEYADPCGQGRIVFTSSPKVSGLAAIHEEEFGGVYLDATIDEFNALGFTYGDSVTITFSNGYRLEDIPYYNGYYTQTGEPLLVAYPGYPHIDACINNGDSLWVLAELKEGDTAELLLEEKGKYLSIQNARDIHYEDERSLFDSDAVFANFRSVKAESMREDVLYRSASPCDDRHNRASYTDALMGEAGVAFIVNLSDNEEKIQGYLTREDFNSPSFLALYEAGKVIPLAMNMNFGSAEFRGKAASGCIGIVENDGPWLVHCTEGKDRTGFFCMLLEALCGATYGEIRDDYMITYDNYYGITGETDPERYGVIVENVLDPMIRSMLGDAQADLTSADLAGGAERFLLAGGMTEAQIAALRAKLMR